MSYERILAGRCNLLGLWLFARRRTVHRENHKIRRARRVSGVHKYDVY